MIRSIAKAGDKTSKLDALIREASATDSRDITQFQSVIRRLLAQYRLSALEPMYAGAKAMCFGNDDIRASLLHSAVIAGNSPIVRFLLDEGFQVNLNIESLGGTSLMAIVTELARLLKNQESIAFLTNTLELLLDRGADTSFVCSAWQDTPLHVLARSSGLQATELLKLLLRYTPAYRIDVESWNVQMRSPLKDAAVAGCVENVRTLLQAGADASVLTGAEEAVLDMD
ncbi:hypothetical protein BC830DRAFT_739273 [Chytriomyces sp. MP71]|nr:hypothetical protein BC830DRAFT_739273 [Chytriomyces sp. MP71]